MTAAAVSPSYDLKNAVSANRLTGLWRMMTGFRLTYLGATVGLAIGALAKTTTYLLLRYFVDNVLGKTQQLQHRCSLDRAGLRAAGAGGRQLHLPQRPAGRADRRGHHAAGCATSCSTTSSG